MAVPMPLRVALSPCPNDTYLFHGWISDHVGAQVPITPIFADIQQLNAWALQKKYPVSKVSIYCLGQILNDYILLPTGCALGHGAGPKIIAKRSLNLSDLNGKRIAIPGRDTTAHLLLKLLCDLPFHPVYCVYSDIATLLNKGEVDAGLIIHETRFTYANQGFLQVADLGELWQKRYHLPLPLGGVVAKRALGQKMLGTITETLGRSLDFAKRFPLKSQAFILAHAQEKQPEVVQNHIHLYVNEETARISAQGRQSIETLFHAARERNLLPHNSLPWLWEEAEQPIHA